MTDAQLAQIVRSFRDELTEDEQLLPFSELHDHFDPNELLDRCATAVLGDIGHGEPMFAILNRCADAITSLAQLDADIVANVTEMLS